MLNDFILIKDYCERCNIEPDFILMLEEDGLIDITVVGESRCFPVAQLPEIERYVHLYYDLSIIREGIGAVKHLLSQIDDLQEEVRRLQNELRFYRSFEEE
mgnify:FL=1